MAAGTERLASAADADEPLEPGAGAGTSASAEAPPLLQLLTAVVTPSQAGERLLSFVTRAFGGSGGAEPGQGGVTAAAVAAAADTAAAAAAAPLRSAGEAKRALKQGRVLRNGAVVDYAQGRAARLGQGDVIALRHDPVAANRERLRAGAPLEVIFDGGAWGVVAKGCGLPSASPLPNALLTAERSLAAHLRPAAVAVPGAGGAMAAALPGGDMRLAYRLDRSTTGLLLGVKTVGAAAVFELMVQEGRLRRRCRALGAGRLAGLEVGAERTLSGEVGGVPRSVRCRLVSLTRTEAECGYISTLDLWCAEPSAGPRAPRTA
jgi:23S rRNA-/tRNA-specific pseudouridylate synthase